jgi:hypothetical protein
LLGDGDGDREADIQDFRAKLEIDPETERALRSRSVASTFLRGLDSYMRSSGVSSAPIVNSDIVN